MAELMVQLVLNRLRRLHVEQGEQVEKNWDLYLPEIQYGLNNRYIRRFGYTPAELMFGRDQSGNSLIFGPREVEILEKEAQAVDVLATHREGAWRETPAQSNVRWSERVAEFLALRDELRDQVTERRLISQDQEIRQAREKLPPSLKVGDLVLLRRHDVDAQKGMKWSERWEGPYRVVKEVKRTCSYMLRSLDGNYIRGRYSIDSLKPFVERKEACLVDTSSPCERGFIPDPELFGRRQFDLRAWRKL